MPTVPKTYGVSRPTSASPQAVWALWSDPNNWTEWNTGIRSAHVDGPLEDGRKGTMTTARGSTHDVEFHDFAEGRGFAMTMAGPPGATLTFVCEITPVPSGGSTIAQSVVISGPMAFLFGPMMGAEMAKHFVPVLDDLARAAESA